MTKKGILTFEPQSLYLPLDDYRNLRREDVERPEAKLEHRPIVIHFGPEEEITQEEELPTLQRY